MDFELKKCIREGNAKLLKFFIKNGANFRKNNEKYLHFAIEQNKLEIVKVLIEAGSYIHVDNFSLINTTVILKRKEILKFLGEKGGNINEGLITAVLNRDKEMVEFLLEIGADKSYQNWFPVMLCFFQENLEMLMVMGKIEEEVKQKGIEYAINFFLLDFLEYFIVKGEKIDFNLIKNENLKDELVKMGIKYNLFLYC